MSDSKRLFFITTVSLRTQVLMYVTVLGILAFMFWPLWSKLIAKLLVLRGFGQILG
jgi:hypothetical protein